MADKNKKSNFWNYTLAILSAGAIGGLTLMYALSNNDEFCPVNHTSTDSHESDVHQSVAHPVTPVVAESRLATETDMHHFQMQRQTAIAVTSTHAPTNVAPTDVTETQPQARF